MEKVLDALNTGMAPRLFSFIREAVAPQPTKMLAANNIYGSPEFKELLIRREIDGLLPVAGMTNDPWENIYRDLWAFQLEALHEILGAFASFNLHAVVFKGAELVTRFYPDSPLGFFVDVDVLINREQIQLAKKVLYGLGYIQSFFDPTSFNLLPRDVRDVGTLEASHYELAPFCKTHSYPCPPQYLDVLARRAQHPAYVKDGALSVVMEIDIHHNVAIDTNAGPLLQRAVNSSCLQGQTLSDSDHLWVNCSRYYNEVALFGKRTLRPLVYTAPLLYGRIDWDIVLASAREHELSASLYYPLRILEAITRTVIPREVLSALNPRLSSGRDFGWQLGPLFEFVEPFPFDEPTLQ
jgi:hypothetical protein